MATFSEKAPLASLDDFPLSGGNNEPRNVPTYTDTTISRDDPTDTVEDDAVEESQEANEDELIALTISGRQVYLRKYRLIACTLKYSLFLFNYIFLIMGIIITACGSWILNERTKLAREISEFMLNPAVLISVFGIILVFITLLGCIGTIRENILLIKILHYSLTVVLFSELILSVIVVVFYQTPKLRNYLHSAPEEIFQKAVKLYHDDGHLQEWLDLLQTEMKCCGFSLDSNGYKDWQLNMYHNCSESNRSYLRCSVPMSCCIIKKGDFINRMCGFGVLDKPRSEVMNRIYTEGCMKQVNSYIQSCNTVIALSSIGIIISQIICVILARLFIRCIIKQRTRWQLLNEVTT